MEQCQVLCVGAWGQKAEFLNIDFVKGIIPLFFPSWAFALASPEPQGLVGLLAPSMIRIDLGHGLTDFYPQLVQKVMNQLPLVGGKLGQLLALERRFAKSPIQRTLLAGQESFSKPGQS